MKPTTHELVEIYKSNYNASMDANRRLEETHHYESVRIGIIISAVTLLDSEEYKAFKEQLAIIHRG